MIINNSLVFQYENMWNSQLSSLSVMNTKVHFKKTGFFNNSIPAVHSYNSDLHSHGANVFRNNIGADCGSALDLRMNSHIYLHQGTQVYILYNVAASMGEEYVWMVVQYLNICFYQIVDLDILNTNDTFVYLEGNVAPITGYAKYAGDVVGCITRITYMDQMSSQGRNLFNISQAIFARVSHQIFGYLPKF